MASVEPHRRGRHRQAPLAGGIARESILLPASASCHSLSRAWHTAGVGKELAVVGAWRGVGRELLKFTLPINKLVIG